MARNFIKYSEYIFELLSTDLTVQNLGNMRLAQNPVAQELAQEVNLFSNASKVEIDYILNNVKIAKFTYDAVNYVLITGLKETDTISSAIFSELEGSHIFEQPLNAGFLLFLVKDANLQRRSDIVLTDLEDKIFYDEYDGYQGHSFLDLADFIEDFTLFRIDPKSQFKKRDSIEAGYFICAHYDKFRKLPINNLSYKYKLLLKNKSPISKENVFLSLTATHYKHAFLELYRCIEVLYGIPRSIKLKQALGYSEKAYRLAGECNSELGWRHKERESMVLILKQIEDKVINTSGIVKVSFFQPEWKFDNTDLTKSSHANLAEKIYLIRNQLVHQFALKDETTLSDTDWNLLIKFLLVVIKRIYQIYRAELPNSFS